MFRNASAGDILTHWQNEIEQRTEAGLNPILELGVSSLTTDSTAALFALQLLAEQRTDAARPIVATGGAGATWLAVLMQPAPPQGVSAPAMLYTGPTLAEHMASVALMHAAVDAPAAGYAGDPVVPAAYFQPRSRPGFNALWETLPFIQTEPVAHEASDSEALSADPTGDWLAWAVLLLALFLVILSILL